MHNFNISKYSKIPLLRFVILCLGIFLFQFRYIYASLKYASLGVLKLHIIAKMHYLVEPGFCGYHLANYFNR